MTESEIIKLIRGLVRQEMAQTLLCNIVETKDNKTGSVKRFSLDNQIDNLRLIFPYGFASRPHKDVASVLQPVNGDHTHLLINGQYDTDGRPSLADGEAALYGADGQVILMKHGKKILVGSLGANEPLVLGNVLKSFMDSLLTLIDSMLTDLLTGPIAVTTTPGNPAPTFPALVAQLTALKVQLATMKAQYVDTSATNFNSIKNFTERGTP